MFQYLLGFIFWSPALAALCLALNKAEQPGVRAKIIAVLGLAAAIGWTNVVMTWPTPARIIAMSSIEAIN